MQQRCANWSAAAGARRVGDLVARARVQPVQANVVEVGEAGRVLSVDLGDALAEEVLVEWGNDVLVPVQFTYQLDGTLVETGLRNVQGHLKQMNGRLKRRRNSEGMNGPLKRRTGD